MLPDYPIFKEKLQEFLINYIRIMQSRMMGVFSEVPRQIIHEGSRSVLVREGKNHDEIDIKKFSHDISWRYDDILSMTLQTVVNKLNEVASSIVEQQSSVFYEEIARGVKEVGNEINVTGESFSPKHFFAILRKIWISFDEYDEPIYPTIIAGSAAYEAIPKVLNEIENNPILLKELQQIIEIKRMEWRDREARRTLVG